MAKLKSSKKRIKQERVQHIRNAAAMSSMRTAVKRFEEDSSQEHLNEALSSLDKAAKRGIIHKNNVARHKSQLMRAANAAS